MTHDERIIALIEMNFQIEQAYQKHLQAEQYYNLLLQEKQKLELDPIYNNDMPDEYIKYGSKFYRVTFHSNRISIRQLESVREL